jgi:type II secretory pathway component PulF
MTENEDRHGSPGTGRQLSGKEADQFAEQLAELSEAGTPLAEGFRAAADETGNRRLRRAFRAAAARIEAGDSLETLLADDRLGISPYVQGAVEAGIRSGRLGQLLTELVEHHRVSRELWRTIYLALAYPGLLIVAVMGVFAFTFLVVLPPVVDMIEDFGTIQSAGTMAVVSLTRASGRALAWVAGGWRILTSWPGLITLIVLGTGLGWAYRWMRRRPAFERVRSHWHWLISTAPFFGPLRTGISVAEFARLLRIMLLQEVPLPAALRLTAAGVADASMAEASRQLAEGTATGRSFSEVMAASPRMPAPLVPVVRWGEQTGQLPEALATITEMFEGRARLRTGLLTSILPPAAFVVVGFAVIGLLVTVTLPLQQLIQNLS